MRKNTRNANYYKIKKFLRKQALENLTQTETAQLVTKMLYRQSPAQIITEIYSS